MDDIPPQLIINWDQTGIKYVPVSSWTMAPRGSKRVEIIGIDDKRQITGVFGCSLSGDFLPVQLIYKGKTQKCLPRSVPFPSDWNITFSENHWSNESTMIEYITKLILPYIDRKKKDFKIGSQQRSLVIFDCFKGQCTESVTELLEKNNVSLVIVPPNCTDRLQPLDLSVNKAAKEHMRSKFHEWHANMVMQQLDKSENKAKPIDLRLSRMKPLGAQWIISTYEYLSSKPEIIKNGFHAAGITNMLL